MCMKYTAPELEIIKFKLEDVLAASDTKPADWEDPNGIEFY